MNPPNINEDWKARIKTQKGRMKYLLENGHAWDVQFMVGKEANEKELFKAHKFVLGTIGSPIFEAQFRFNKTIRQPKDEPIKVIDVKPAAFKAMLNYLYLEDFSAVNKENVAFVFDAAKKYLLSVLADECVQLALSTMLDVKNVLDVLEVAELHEEKPLFDGAWLFMDQNIADFVETDEFLSLEQEEIAELLARDTLHCDELTIFQGPTGKQKRVAIGEALNSIRFPLINSEEFITEIVPTKILDEEEIVAISLFHAGKTIDEVKAIHPLPLLHNCCAKQRNDGSNVRDHGPNLEILENGLVVAYRSSHFSWGVNSVRFLPIRKFNRKAKMPYLAFYFEVEFLKKSKCITIGLCDKHFRLKGNSPGDVENSIGIWCKSKVKIDGRIINLGYHTGRFKTRNVVGLGLVYFPANSKLKCFATDGRWTMLAMIELPEKFIGLQLFPVVSLNEVEDSIRVNFGKDPWNYDPSNVVQRV